MLNLQKGIYKKMAIPIIPKHIMIQFVSPSLDIQRSGPDIKRRPVGSLDQTQPDCRRQVHQASRRRPDTGGYFIFVLFFTS